MAKLNGLKKGSWLWIATCIIFFFVGLIFGKTWPTLSMQIVDTQKPTSQALLTFNIPQVPIPSNWLTKQNSPGNSFETAFPLNTGIDTQGTLNENNVIDYYVFTLKNPSQIIVTITNVPKALYWVLYDSQLKEVATSYRSGTSQGSSQMALQNPGKYYIKAWADYSQQVNYPYTIRLSVLPYFE